MSVINKMLQDLDKRGATHGRVEESIPGTAIPRQRASAGRRWKIAAFALMVPLVLAIGWIVVLLSSSVSSDGQKKSPQSTPLAQVTPQPADAQKKDVATPQAPVPQQAPVVADARPKTSEVVAQASVTPKESASKSPQSTPPAQVTPQPAAVKKKSAETPQAPAAQQQAPVVAAAQPKAAVVVAQANVTPKEPASKAEAPPREIKQDRKPMERTDSALSISKKPPAATPEKTASKNPVPEAAVKPSAPAPVADTAQAAAPAQDTTKSSISVERQDRDSSRPERASAEYRRAVELMNQGRVELAFDAYSRALSLDPKHAAARQALVALLMGRGRVADAQGVLREGLAALPDNTAWAMLLARLQVEGGDRAGALATLDGALPYAKNQPDYHAFVGTLLQMQGRHKEAIAHYDIAVRLSPASGRWLTGLAISLEEEKQLPEAREAYQRALATNTLAPDLRAFVERKLVQLK